MKNAIAIRHVAFEDAGILAGLLQDRGIGLTYLEAGVDDLGPAKDADLLLVLGGPIGIYEVERYPFLKRELAIIETAVKKDVPTIGICLGCQALAAVLAARVYPGREKELGWDEMALTEGGQGFAARRDRRRPRAQLAWRHVRSSRGRDPSRLDQDHAEPGLRLWSPCARAAIPCRAAFARYREMADRSHDGARPTPKPISPRFATRPRASPPPPIEQACACSMTGSTRFPDRLDTALPQPEAILMLRDGPAALLWHDGVQFVLGDHAVAARQSYRPGRAVARPSTHYVLSVAKSWMPGPGPGMTS